MERGICRFLVVMAFLPFLLAAKDTDYKAKHTGPKLMALSMARMEVPIDLGQIDGKNFTAVNVQGSWLSSLDVCHKNNRRLATIETLQQMRLLAMDLKYRTTASWAKGYFWTAGHDFGTEGQFHWFGTDAPVSSALRTDLTISQDRNCVQLGWNNQLFDYDCADTEAIALCED